MRHPPWSFHAWRPRNPLVGFGAICAVLGEPGMVRSPCKLAPLSAPESRAGFDLCSHSSLLLGPSRQGVHKTCAQNINIPSANEFIED